MSINNFQVRFAFVNTDDGTLTPEAFRVLRTWFTRIGGFDSVSNEDLEQMAQLALQTFAPDVTAQRDITDLQLSHPIDQSAHLAALACRCDELQAQLTALSNASSESTGLRQRVNDIELASDYRDQFRVNWERPGKIGSLTVNSGAFTTLSASGGLSTGLATSLVSSSVAMNNGAAAGAGTLTNSPAAGNPTKWIPINDNGTTRYIPTW